MFIVNCIGGLGNQLFQYGLYVRLKSEYPRENVFFDIQMFDKYTLHNGYELDSIFNLDIDYANKYQKLLLTSHGFTSSVRAIRKIFPKFEVIEREECEFQYFPEFIENKENKYYKGYWQNYKYLIPVKEKLRKELSFSLDINDNKNIQCLNEIRNSNSVSIHVRRGDYIGHSLLGGICDLDYYKRAIKKTYELIDNPVFYIFSNDVSWVKENFAFINPIIIDFNKGCDSYKDMMLMSQCKLNVIANSSFSWWGAFLNNNQKYNVITPIYWTNSLIETKSLSPDDWISV
ncbi:alpha-1,2-fucosyltransferase [Photobacterium kishitanii]|uniref:alpha-1,2-fucosyltransferase n=1 Tax=Photobacterium kishitanii TaxID=318456 RepID=UPI000D1514A5|nr:alpha-1,2-fucosyltransferase [Photobacterium kishitanii]PSW60647.1 alpha-1,2-fucosyltransferase [Photobacterium kishitanii]